MATKTILAAAVLCAASSAAAQPAPQKITIGIYAPSVEFGTAQARLAYVQGLAKAIEQNTGVKTEAQSYASLGALKKDAVDFAIIDGQCYATNLGYKLIAAANIGGGTSRAWALFSNAGDLSALKGKKLAIINTGCNDAGFVDNAMLESEVDPSHFGSRVGKPDLSAAVAEVASYKTAQAVFAPSVSAKGLTKLFDTGSVPNPAFVDLGGKLPAATVEKVSSAVLGYGGGGAIASWQRGEVASYRGLAGRLGKVNKQGVLVAPELVRIDAKDVLSEPATLKDTASADVRHHFLRSPGARME
jgi:hypothetical protein